MKQRGFIWVMMAGAMLLATGCKSLFPDTRTVTESRWHSYDQAAAAFEKIIPYHTRTNELQQLGFHPAASPNVKILTYVDLVQIFLPNPGLRQRDLPAAVRDCLAARDDGQAYLVELQDIRSLRHGNLFLDVFGFKRRTHESGWRFKGLILLKENVVVYKLSSGEPQISREERRIKPLGPLQELDSVFFRAVDLAK